MKYNKLRMKLINLTKGQAKQIFRWVLAAETRLQEGKSPHLRSTFKIEWDFGSTHNDRQF